MNNVSENGQTKISKADAEKLFAEEIEKLARPLCEKIQSLPASLREDFEAKKVLNHHEFSIRQDLMLKVFDYMSNKPKFAKVLDGLTCVSVLDASLQAYKADAYEGEVYNNEKLDFWRYFCNQYWKRVAPWKKRPLEEFGLKDTNYEIRGQKVKDFLRLLAAKARFSEQEMEALKLDEKGGYYAKQDNALRILAGLGYDENSRQAKEVKALLAQSNLDYYDQTVSPEDETANRYAGVDKATYAVDREQEVIADSLVGLLERAFGVARETSGVNEEYLKGIVTLYVLSAEDALSEGIRPYIIVPFYEQHRRDKYSSDATEASINRERKYAMAEYFNLQPDTWRKKVKELKVFLMGTYQTADV